MTSGTAASGIAFAARLVSGANARWVEPLRTDARCIFYANHTSHLDAVVIWALLPSEARAMTRPIAAKDYWERGLLKPVLARHVFNSVLIPRRSSDITDPEAVRAAAREAVSCTAAALDRNYSAIIFPEGTRGTGDDVAQFKSGLFHLCELCPDLLLVPVYIENLNRVMPKGTFLPIPLLTHVTFGAPLERIDGEGRDEFLARARDALVALRR